MGSGPRAHGECTGGDSLVLSNNISAAHHALEKAVK